jgi:hypothetical protein
MKQKSNFSHNSPISKCDRGYKPFLNISLKLLLVLQLWLAPIALTYAQAPATTPTKPPVTTPTKPPVTTPKEGTSPTTTPTTKPAREIGPVEKTIGQYLCTPTVDTNLYSCINKLYRFSLAAGFFIAVLFIVVAGYLYMTGGEKGISTAKSIVSSTFIAIIIMSTSYILLRQINPELVKFKPIQPLNINDTKDISLEDFDLDVPILGDGINNSGGAGYAGGKPGSGSEQKYSTLIDTYAKQRDIEYCALSALMEKESSYDNLAVSNGPPRYVDPNNPNKQVYNITDFDNKYHAIGLLQITIYEKRRGLKNGWTNGVPAREGAPFGFDRPLYVTDLIDPEINVKAGSHYFANLIEHNNGNLYEAYRGYQGKNSLTSTLDKYIEMYNRCKTR